MLRSIFFLFCTLFFVTVVDADQLIIEPDAGRQPLLSAIQQATHSIDVVMYGFTDSAFSDSLINAKQHGKDVRVLLEPQPYRAETENNAVIKQLQAANIKLQWPSTTYQLTHQKTFIFDEQTALILTFNLTHSTFKNERNFALLVTNPQMVQEIEKVFSADWAHQTVTVNNPNLLWSPNNSREKILDFIRNAHSSLMIYAEDVSDYQTIGALANAARRGVKIKILVSTNPEKFHGKKFAYLNKAGVDIHNSQTMLIHAKVIIADQERAILGSINLTKPSMNDNRELSVITTDPMIIKPLLATFASDWRGGHTLAKKHAYKNQIALHHLLRKLTRLYNKLS